MPIELDQEKRKALVESLLSAFMSTSLLDNAVFLELGIKLDDSFDLQDGRKIVYTKTVELAESEGWVEQLIRVAVRRAGGNPKVQHIAASLGVGPLRLQDLPAEVRKKSRSLEEVIRFRRPPILMQLFSERLAVASRAVCWIGLRNGAADNPQLGTGFLVGPNLLLTNHHVIEKVLQRELDPADIVCRFDYLQATRAGEAPPACGLAEPWCLDHGRYAPSDVFTDGQAPQPEELDYALLRLSREIGRETGGGGAQRGWLETSASPPPLQKDDFLMVVQHPAMSQDALAGAQRIAVGLVLNFNAGFTRLQHDASTTSGSSGSPCFSMDVQLAALHHGAEPLVDSQGDEVASQPTYNRAIPLRLILRQMKQRGVEKFWSHTPVIGG